jgi:hypothetical protein
VANKGLSQRPRKTNEKKSLPEDELIRHVVLQGESFGGLALKYETTTLALQILNRFPSAHPQLKPNEVKKLK